MKMTVADQTKILDKKIKQNEALYDLDRKAAKISALSSEDLKKYEYLTGENLGYKPSALKKTKFEYSPLGKVFNKGLDEEDKNEGILKRQNKKEAKNEEQLKEIKNQRKKKIVDKDTKAAKFKNPLIYDPKHTNYKLHYKYRLNEFNKIPSIDS